LIFGKNRQLYGAGNADWAMILLYFVMCAILAAIYLMKRNRANLALLSSFLFLIVAVFMLNSNPLSISPALVILLFAVVAIGDRRLLGQYFILSLVSLFNIGAVMLNGLYLNGLPDYMFDNGLNNPNVYFTQYSVERLTLSNGLMIAGSVLLALAFVWFMMVAMDITVSNKRKLFLKNNEKAPLLRPDSFFSIFK
jgi:hypothetical protein